MRYGRSRNTHEDPSPKRRLKTKPLLVLIGILFVCNLFWFIAWLLPDKPKAVKDEEVASVNGEPIMREEWMTAMEKAIGHETLLRLVNDKVMEAAAEKFDIDVSDEEIDLELALIHSVDNHSYVGLDAENERQKIRSMLILEKVLTKDVVIDEEEIRKNYDKNTSLYNIDTAYRTEVIVVSSKEEAEQAQLELKEGSDFNVLAKERSIDPVSANLGGDLGYINEKTESVDKSVGEAASKLKEKGTSGVIELDNGSFAIIRVSDIMEGRSFTFKEVADHIRRELALEQLPESVTPEAFWKEFDARWFYGD